MSGTPLRRLRLLGLATLLWFAIGGELLCRFQGDWRLDTLRLTKRPSPPLQPLRGRDGERVLLASVTYQEGVDPDWFFRPPPGIEKPENPVLEARAAANPMEETQPENYVWNDALLAHPNAYVLTLFRRLKVDTVFAFPSYNGLPFPRYRLYSDYDYRPTPWITDNWGWLGPDVTVRKPAHTIRVGIIGDSGSLNLAGFYLQGFLDSWAQAHGLDVRFEVLNAARFGMTFEDGLATVQFELGPMGLDFVYKYYGPQFSVAMPEVLAFARLPPGVKLASPPHVRPMFDVVRRAVNRLAPVSALARRASGLIAHDAEDSSLSEPGKPRVEMHLPPVNGDKAVMSEAMKEPYFARVAANLDRFKGVAESVHATPLVSTERLCVWDGMVLQSGANRVLYRAINEALWPFSYADLRRILAVNNGVIRAWAAENGVTAVDIDGRMPRRPELCVDAHHDTPFSHQLRAWLMFQAMVPQLTRDLARQAVPRDNAEKSGRHPYLDKPIEVLDRQQWLAQIDAQTAKGAAVTR